MRMLVGGVRCAVSASPIPGTESPKRLEENANAVNVNLSSAEIAELDNAIAPNAVHGSRYPDRMMAPITR